MFGRRVKVASKTIAVYGAGAWGTALGIHLAKKGHSVLLWSNEPKILATMISTRCNDRYLPGVKLPDQLEVTAHLHDVAQLPNWLIAVPSHAFSAVLSQASALNNRPEQISWASKGLCSQTGGLLHHAAYQIIDQSQDIAVISGPSFAREVALGMPTAVTIGASSDAAAHFWSNCFSSETFSVYTTSDLMGVQIGGAVKNVIAIAAGMSDGLGYGANARCALITRGLSEMSKLAAAMGADPRTLMGLSGVGDLVLTCTDDQSRNRRCGYRLGQGQCLTDIQRVIGQVIEGVMAAKQVESLARAMGLSMPITSMVLAVLQQDVTAAEAFDRFFSHSPVPE